jgi:hypothetical protein
MNRRSGFLFLLFAASLLVAGCTINTHDNGKADGKDKNVDIKTPFGSMQVKTDKAAPDSVGLAVYPGAQLKPQEEHNDNKANVNIDTPWFGLRVAAFKYLSDDSPDKVLEFYKKELARYGKVLACKGKTNDFNVKKSSRDKNSSEELTCEHGQYDVETVHVDTSDGIELKAGTQSRQHVVGIKPRGNGSEFDLVYVQVHGDKQEPI